MTPASIAGFAKLNGLELAALTDHNSARNCAAFERAARAYGLASLCGLELTDIRDIHVLCLFETAAQQRPACDLCRAENYPGKKP